MTTEFQLRFLKIPNSKSLRFIRQVCCKYIFIYTVFCGTILTALILHYFKYETAFPRSGAILVCFAIIFVYMNHFISTSLQKLNSRAAEFEGMAMDLKQVDMSIQTNQALNSTVTQLQSTVKNEVEVTTIAQHKLVTAEFIMGVSGTFIWGFGDLLPLFA